MQHSFNETLVHLPARRCSLCRWEHSKLTWVLTKAHLSEKGWAKWCPSLEQFGHLQVSHLSSRSPPSYGSCQPGWWLTHAYSGTHEVSQPNLCVRVLVLHHKAAKHTRRKSPSTFFCMHEPADATDWLVSLWANYDEQMRKHAISFAHTAWPILLVWLAATDDRSVIWIQIPNLPTKGQMHFFAVELFYAETLLQLACFPDSFPWNYTSLTSIHMKALRRWPWFSDIKLDPLLNSCRLFLRFFPIAAKKLFYWSMIGDFIAVFCIIYTIMTTASELCSFFFFLFFFFMSFSTKIAKA